jgi:hypothetical protein
MFRNFFKNNMYIGNLNYIIESYEDLNIEDFYNYLEQYNSLIMPLSLFCTNSNIYIDNKFTPLMHITNITNKY